MLPVGLTCGMSAVRIVCGVLKYILMVSVAKRLRRQVVALEIEGSNPFTHPSQISPWAISYMPPYHLP